MKFKCNWKITYFELVFGFVVEMLYATVYTRTLVIRQGLIYGPFIQVYGMGAVAYYFLITKLLFLQSITTLLEGKISCFKIFSAISVSNFFVTNLLSGLAPYEIS